MATPSLSSLNSSRESEPVLECRLVLSLSGTVVEITTSVAKYDRLEDLEDHVVDYLASVTDLKVFGCTVDFLYPNTHTYLDDPIWEGLQQIGTASIRADHYCCGSGWSIGVILRK